ncbi:MAG: M23 family metallopeptidase [Salibacteraceae bacterium]
MENKEKKKKIVRRLRNKYRLVILNDDTFEERVSLILSPLNVATWGGLIIILLVTITVVTIAYTPLKELIPGYADVRTMRLAAYAALKTDSLEVSLRQNEVYLENLQAVMMGEPPSEDTLSSKTNLNYAGVEAAPSAADSAFRAEIEAEDPYNLAFQPDENTNRDINSFFFFTPINGVVTSGFSGTDKHFGVDIVAPKNEAVKATLDGTVVLAVWTYETGHLIQIQHDNDLISVYKHNAVLLKNMGDQVRAGEAIAIIGESGENQSGPHLHFELWYKGKPVDPTRFMVF